jgi:putative acetyltransferase
MDQDIIIRNETDDDIVAITNLTIEAFKTLDVSQHNEQDLICALREAGALSVSLVAERESTIVGHCAFSPVTISDNTPNWYGLGPISVLPKYQRTGIGTALIKEGFTRMAARNARGCCVVGHPEYYPRLGFTKVEGLSLPGVPPEVFFALSFDGHMPQGEVAFHAAFGSH